MAAASKSSSGAGATWVSSLSGHRFEVGASSSAVSASTAVTVPALGAREDRNSMMAAFSDLELELDANGAPTTATNASKSSSTSSSSALLAAKEAEQRMEAMRQAQRLAHKQERAQQMQQKREATASAKPMSALSQAMDAFESEMKESTSSMSSLERRRARGYPTPSMRGGSRRGGGGGPAGLKSQRSAKRAQRKESYRRV